MLSLTKELNGNISSGEMYFIPQLLANSLSLSEKSPGLPKASPTKNDSFLLTIFLPSIYKLYICGLGFLNSLLNSINIIIGISKLDNTLRICSTLKTLVFV